VGVSKWSGGKLRVVNAAGRPRFLPKTFFFQYDRRAEVETLGVTFRRGLL
jgi:hypothetical protein